MEPVLVDEAIVDHRLREALAVEVRFFDDVVRL